MIDLGSPLKIQWGQKWHRNQPSGATNLKFLALRSVCFEFFGVPNSGSTSGSIFNRFWVDLCSFFAVFGAYTNRFRTSLDTKFNRFGTACVSQLPTPQRGLTQNTRSQISESVKICLNLPGVCQDLPGICQESAGPSHTLAP